MDDADDRILSVYRATVLSSAGEARPAKREIQRCLRIPAEIPSRDGGRKETSIDVVR
jgi:hypothetical protein